ncbi:hypothetical protein NCWK1_0601 [Nostoc cycadae WK-1]|uniref:Uncharacterized protein n=1 Tax=Nostoc cycadae WK-1 TaxID=1861711 RepID=A0A2H6LCC2_9NOSO|nr:hypothetical protein NCWK1_0601 [Nostoc cycadae WK-1]
MVSVTWAVDVELVSGADGFSAVGVLLQALKLTIAAVAMVKQKYLNFFMFLTVGMTQCRRFGYAHFAGNAILLQLLMKFLNLF